jgi:hypothetical protein
MHSTARLLALSLCVAGLALPAAADASVLHVTTTADVGPGDTCRFARRWTRRTRRCAPPLTEALYNGMLTIVGGTARDTTIDGADQATIFTVATGGSLELRELTLRDGKTELAGGGIRNDGTLTLRDMALVTAGANRVRFSGRVLVRGRARALRPGRYRARLQAVDTAGNRSAPATIRFRVVAAVRSR